MQFSVIAIWREACVIRHSLINSSGMIVIGGSCPPGVNGLGGGICRRRGRGSCPRGLVVLEGNNNNNNNNILFTQGSHFSYETALPAGPA